MKISGRKLEVMRTAMRAVVEHYGLEKIKAAYADVTQTQMLWELWNVASDNLRYNNGHPGFAKGHWPRVIPHDTTFDVYSDGVNDSHIETALKVIGKELGL